MGLSTVRSSPLLQLSDSYRALASSCRLPCTRRYISSHLRWVLLTSPVFTRVAKWLWRFVTHQHYTTNIPLSTCEYKVWYYRKRWNDLRKEYSASSSPQQSSSLRCSHRYHTWSLSTKNISIYTNANSLPFLLYLVIHRVCARQGDGATKGPQIAERSRHDSPERYQLVKDCRTNSSFY